jgi:hypothetical protein
MTTNSYFQNSGQGVGSNSERDLVESNIIEMIQLAGHDCFYIPRTIFNPDHFYHEVPSDKFETYSRIEMYVTNVTDFGGQGDYMSKFGLKVEDTVELVCSRFRFTEETGLDNPSEGDLIYFPLSKHLFQIDFVEDEPGNAGSVNQFYQLSRLYTFLFKCTLFDYSYEDFDTGLATIDTQFDSTTYEPKSKDNEIINTEADDVLDWSESNPFGRTTE